METFKTVILIKKKKKVCYLKMHYALKAFASNKAKKIVKLLQKAAM